MSVHWLAELDPSLFELESPADPMRGPGVIVISAAELERIAHYATSIPTGPSPGRVYRRHYGPLRVGNPSEPEADFVFVVIDAPDGHGQLHVPHEALVVA